MITFLTLFLSLVAGPQQIEVAVGPEVARVEVLLDGKGIGALTEPPWSLRHDFRKELVPRELLAIARDENGKEVGRARQLLNVPHPRAGATLAVEGAADARRARLAWTSVEGIEPESVALHLDGREVPFTDPASIPLPKVDGEQVHLLTAAVTFGDGLEVRAWQSFGGSFGDRSEAELTAFPVRTSSPADDLGPADLRGKVWAKGVPLQVVAVEGGDGGAEILLVRAPETRSALIRLGRGENNPSTDEHGLDPLRNLPRFLHRSDHFNVLATWTSASEEGTQASLFPLLITDRRLLQAGLPRILTLGFAPVPEKARHRLADAVAAAGRAAAGNRRPRAVVLVVGGPSKDLSFYSPSQVRRYLEMLRVPLTVWHIPTRRGQKPPAAWGEAADISTPIRLRQALARLRGELDRQRIVWVQGSHLPQDVRLDPEVAAITLAQ